MQATIGKRILGLRVLDARGIRMTIGRALGRNHAKIISYIPPGLGFLWALWSKRRQGWHDLIAKTIVVRLGEGRYPNNALPIMKVGNS
jgi:uncharacterized RDD family membrane protein YckC